MAGDLRPAASTPLTGDFLGRRRLEVRVKGDDLFLGGATGVAASPPASSLDWEDLVGCMKDGVPVLRRPAGLTPSDIGVVLLGRS